MIARHFNVPSISRVNLHVTSDWQSLEQARNPPVPGCRHRKVIALEFVFRIGTPIPATVPQFSHRALAGRSDLSQPSYRFRWTNQSTDEI